MALPVRVSDICCLFPLGAYFQIGARCDLTKYLFRPQAAHSEGRFIITPEYSEFNVSEWVFKYARKYKNQLYLKYQI